MQTLVRLILFISMSVLLGCQNLNSGSQEQAYYMEPSEQGLINTYHNVHYNNPGFYPRGEYYNGGLYYMRGYRY